MFKLIIFDCDGVLVDSEKIANEVFSQVLNKECGLNLSLEDMFNTFVGHSSKQCMQIIADMLGKKLDEAHWQAFFNQNPFILHMAFGYPVIEVQDQASVGGRKLSGKGEKITDFLLKNALTNNTALFEIKTPQTKLLAKTAYRGGVYPPAKDLSGSMNQMLDQRYQFQREVSSIKDKSKLWDLESYAVHCCLIIGKTPEGEDEKKSFEIFRRNSKDVSVVTFDELLEKLKQLKAFLTEADTMEAKV